MRHVMAEQVRVRHVRVRHVRVSTWLLTVLEPARNITCRASYYHVVPSRLEGASSQLN